ncbi:MFS transporter [Myxococcus sp. XM-1-1-1]|jgi:predicted MFS family arabinose efflux permease|uniref:MFS transporter n=1 Tax=Myxococcus sp. XM-1-1-1 TaxID=2874602 RepID=UPI001CC133C9|nr:MFS transporter [Myxococcus sp. XM-1-1-1]MBZ4410424.1 MFS transporter [Myxococcus sp. XM-1-1-1]
MRRESKVVEPAGRGAPGLSGAVTGLLAVACGLAVANVYYAQPLLDAMARELGLQPATVGVVVTVTQVGYGLGLLLLVPLGDLVERRRLVALQMLLSVAALTLVGLAPSGAVLLGALAVVGLLAVVTQVLVAFSASLASPAERGRVVGLVTSGVVIGILMARTVAGFLSDVAGWRSVYLVSAGATLLVALALLRVLPRERARTRLSYPELLRSVLTLFVEEPVLRVRAVLALLGFAAFSTLWTPMVLLLAAPPFSLSHTQVGLFGLAGVAGALGASRAGRLADRGFGNRTTLFALGLLLVSWVPIVLTQTHQSLWALGLGIIGLDLAIQALHVTNQSELYAVRPEARSRLVAGYMVFYSIGSGAGSLASTVVFAHAGWVGVCVQGAAIAAVALGFWGVTRLAARERGFARVRRVSS